MKKRIAIISMAVFILATLAVVLALAQTGSEIELSSESIRTDRQKIVSQYMKLSDQEADKFWPIYKNYRSDMSKLNGKLLSLAQDFVKNYKTLTDKQARTLLSDFQDIQAQRLKTQSSYAPKFESAVGSKKTLRFYQLENKMDAVVNYDLTGVTPLAQ